MFGIDGTLILIFLTLGLVLYIISSHKKAKKVQFNETVDIIRPSYGNEFYNYSGGDETTIIGDNIDAKIVELTNQEKVVEGFSLKMKESHSKCPVINGAKTRVTSCIHYPNRYMKGLGEKVDKGFLVSTHTKKEIDTIQQSLKRNDKIHDIIYKNGEYILMNNNIEKQTLMECNPPNYQTITSLAGTFS